MQLAQVKKGGCFGIVCKGRHSEFIASECISLPTFRLHSLKLFGSLLFRKADVDAFIYRLFYNKGGGGGADHSVSSENAMKAKSAF